MSSVKHTIYSLVVDSDPRFAYEAFHLVKSLLRHCAAKPDDINVHFTREVSSAVKQTFCGLGCRLHKVDAFGDRRYCNKIVQLDNLLCLEFDRAILLDTDMIVLSDPRPFLETDPVVQGKVVDIVNPSLPALLEIAARAGFSTKLQTAEVDNGSGLTCLGNCNGGFYVIPNRDAARISRDWQRWALWLLDDCGELRREGKDSHIDQVSMWLTLLATRIPFIPAPSNVNYYVHFAGPHLHCKPDFPISILHYHNCLNALGLIDPPQALPKEGADAVDVANEQIKGSYQDALFWDWRYQYFPGLGSGVGSRGKVLSEKRRLLEPFAYIFDSAIDVGCGDMEATRELPFIDYLGVDRSVTALGLAAAKDGKRAFLSLSDFEACSHNAELVLCLDATIHQASRLEYQGLIDLVLARSTSVALVSGYEESPSYSSHIVYFHEALSMTLGKHPRVSRVERLGMYRDVVLLAAIIKDGVYARNSSQMSLSAFSRAFTEVPWRRELAELYRISVRRLGFFTNHYPRAFEYPWVCVHSGSLGEGSRILDLGAGISPLPLWFAERGCEVLTVDNHELNRTGTDVANWNEWGFLDYSTLHKSVKSEQVDMENLEPSNRFHLIYSVSVIEHLPALRRQEVIRRLRELLHAGGKLLITVDLVRDTDQLWNMSAGQVVDEHDEHGTLSLLLNELIRQGFRISGHETRRTIVDARVDVAFIDAYHPG